MFGSEVNLRHQLKEICSARKEAKSVRSRHGAAGVVPEGVLAWRRQELDPKSAVPGPFAASAKKALVAGGGQARILRTSPSLDLSGPGVSHENGRCRAIIGGWTILRDAARPALAPAPTSSTRPWSRGTSNAGEHCRRHGAHLAAGGLMAPTSVGREGLRSCPGDPHTSAWKGRPRCQVHMRTAHIIKMLSSACPTHLQQRCVERKKFPQAGNWRRYKAGGLPSQRRPQGALARQHPRVHGVSTRRQRRINPPIALRGVRRRLRISRFRSMQPATRFSRIACWPKPGARSCPGPNRRDSDALGTVRQVICDRRPIGAGSVKANPNMLRMESAAGMQAIRVRTQCRRRPDLAAARTRIHFI